MIRRIVLNTEYNNDEELDLQLLYEDNTHDNLIIDFDKSELISEPLGDIELKSLLNIGDNSDDLDILDLDISDQEDDSILPINFLQIFSESEAELEIDNILDKSSANSTSPEEIVAEFFREFESIITFQNYLKSTKTRESYRKNLQDDLRKYAQKKLDTLDEVYLDTVVSAVMSKTPVEAIVNNIFRKGFVTSNTIRSKLMTQISDLKKKYSLLNVDNSIDMGSNTVLGDRIAELLHSISNILSVNNALAEDGWINLVGRVVYVTSVNLVDHTYICGDPECSGVSYWSYPFVQSYLTRDKKEDNCFLVIPWFELCKKCNKINILSEDKFKALEQSLPAKNSNYQALTVFRDTINIGYHNFWIYPYDVPLNLLNEILPTTYLHAPVLNNILENVSESQIDINEMLHGYNIKISRFTARSTYSNSYNLLARVFCGIMSLSYDTMKNSACLGFVTYLDNNIGNLLDVTKQYEVLLDYCKYGRNTDINILKSTIYSKLKILASMFSNITIFGTVPFDIEYHIDTDTLRERIYKFSDIVAYIFPELLETSVNGITFPTLTDLLGIVTDCMILYKLRDCVLTYSGVECSKLWNSNRESFKTRIRKFYSQITQKTGYIVKQEDLDSFEMALNELFDLSDYTDVSGLIKCLLDKNYDDFISIFNNTKSELPETLCASIEAKLKTLNSDEFLENYSIKLGLINYSLMYNSIKSPVEAIKYGVILLCNYIGFDTYIQTLDIGDSIVREILVNSEEWKLLKYPTQFLESYVLVNFDYLDEDIDDIMKTSFSSDVGLLDDSDKLKQLSAFYGTKEFENEFVITDPILRDRLFMYLKGFGNIR